MVAGTWLVPDVRMVIGGLWYLLPVTCWIPGMHYACVELDELGASATLLILTVLVPIVPALILSWSSCNSYSAHTPTHKTCLCSQLRTAAGTLILSSLCSNQRFPNLPEPLKPIHSFLLETRQSEFWTTVALACSHAGLNSRIVAEHDTQSPGRSSI